MKFYPFRIFLILIVAFGFTACDWLNTEEAELSSNANFISLKFSYIHTEDAAVANASFTYEYDALLGDSVIVNLDSLPYNTAIDTVKPTFTFYSTAGSYLLLNKVTGTGFDTIAISGNDTINFNRVVSVTNKSSDGKTEKIYKIKVNVHKVEPELYQWFKITDALYDHAANIQKGVYVNDSIYFFTSTGLNASVMKSPNGREWTSKTDVSDLPYGAAIGNMHVYNNKIYLIHNDSTIYYSIYGVKWTKGIIRDVNYDFKSLLYNFKGKLWALVQLRSDASYKFAYSVDGITWVVDLATQVADDFPVTGFTTASFFTRTNLPKVVVAGGYNKNGTLQNKVWSSLDGKYWLDFSTENLTFGFRGSSSIISYEDKLLAFGGVNDDAVMQDNLFIQSVDEGLSWKNIDTTKMTIREPYTFVRKDSTIKAYYPYKPRYNQSVIVDKNKFIILIGGRNSDATIFKDVWIGRLNKSVFIRK